MKKIEDPLQNHVGSFGTLSQKTGLNSSSWLKKIFKFDCLDWLKIIKKLTLKIIQK